MSENTQINLENHVHAMVGTFLKDVKYRNLMLSPTAQKYVEVLVLGWFYDPPLITRRPTFALMTTLTELVLQEVLDDPLFETEMSVRSYVSFSTLTYCLSVTTKKVMRRMELGFRRSEHPEDTY
jgi:hypothetical protein